MMLEILRRDVAWVSGAGEVEKSVWRDDGECHGQLSEAADVGPDLRQEHDFRHPHDSEEEDLTPSQKSWASNDTVLAVGLFKAYHYGGMSVIHEMLPESGQ
jgi:hypothetical protein